MKCEKCPERARIFFRGEDLCWTCFNLHPDQRNPNKVAEQLERTAWPARGSGKPRTHAEGCECPKCGGAANGG